MNERPDVRLPVFDSSLERPHVIVHAFNAFEMGIPLVELWIDGELVNLTCGQARRIGMALVAASGLSSQQEDGRWNNDCIEGCRPADKHCEG